ncbi:hypothetical protein OH76DRAFT_1352674 [Lentinus brumalis]|uniref:Uncharacterized protein n=1 Tax=Lentinus brumalis TaxID=2498619 RepID=A0A371D782_9APHY|nr:hypothetical protein OH76DRAFT_1352674 [Polyporus brumalis]
MAPTLAFRSPGLSHLVPPPSQDFAMQQMPNVFVIPPEEEQGYNPPFMYFDASQAASSSLCISPDLDALDVALGLCQQTDNRAPTFHRSFTNESQDTIVMPRRASLMKLTNMDVDLDTENGQTDIRSRGGVRKYDEEIVEVVKVRRNEGIADVGEGRKMKKSNTFRARASQALRSIKLNVGKSSQRRASVSVPRERERELELEREQSELQAAATLPSRHPYQEEFQPSLKPKSPTMSRRRSVTIGALFTTFSNRDKPSSRPASPSEELMSPSSPTLVSSGSPSIPPSRPMSPTDSIASSHTHRLQPALSIDDFSATPTKSPTLAPEPLNAAQPALSKRKSFRRRLSILELQNLFKIGGSNPSPTEPVTPADQAEDLFSPSRSRPKSMDTAGILSASSSRSSNATFSSSFTDLTARRSASTADLSLVNEDAELEMRLDSLHFDSLHIDPDDILSGLDLAD